ncbi:MAG: fatty-acid-CoA ligase [Acidimicrobiales bacterium]|nr:fatty-acid-CoA ligase [Acidimicrobiales bacterium]
MDFNLAEVHEAVAAANPDRECIVWRDRRLTYGEVTVRTRRLANALRARGLGVHRERGELAGHESGQDHVALYLFNGNEYLESMLGAYKARVAPLNVNYRYVAEELQYLLRNSRSRGIVYHATFAPTLAAVLPQLPDLEVLVQVADDSGHELLAGAVDYEAFLAGASPERPDVAWSPDDLYILYTGGTTGMPKGVLWRQHDIFVAAMGGRPLGQGDTFADLDAVVAASRGGGGRMMTAAPLMHGAAQWGTFTAFTGGNTVVLPANSQRLDPVDVLSTIAAEGVMILQIVGDAFARPILDELERGSYDLASLFLIVSGGAALNTTLKDRFLECLPNAVVLDAVGSSETGAQMGHTSTKGATATGEFTPGPGTVVVSEDLTRVLEPGDPAVGWLAQQGHVPLGYLDDPDKTARTFPVIAGTRYSVPGDRATWRTDGIIDLLGRDSVTINSGGEKIFAEEVEQAIAHHRDVYDVVVVGRPSEQWGAEVVALVQLADGATVTDQQLLDQAATHIARYKLPKQIVRLDQLVRSPAGKADYRWAKDQALAHTTAADPGGAAQP